MLLMEMVSALKCLSVFVLLSVRILGASVFAGKGKGNYGTALLLTHAPSMFSIIGYG